MDRQCSGITKGVAVRGDLFSLDTYTSSCHKDGRRRRGLACASATPRGIAPMSGRLLVW